MTVDLTARRAPRPPGTALAMLLIARRGALEALRDRTTVFMGLFFGFVFPVFMLATAVRASAEGAGAGAGNLLAFYLLVLGLLPTTAGIGVASGQFAGEKEQGSLVPLLACPASNLAIFAGKVLGAVGPALLFAALAEATYFVGLAVSGGAERIELLPPALSAAMLLLVPGVAVFAATVASLISSRVRTYNTAQQLGGLALLPLWGGVFALATRMESWSALGLLVVVLVLYAIDAALAILAAATWRREEVLAHR